MCAGGAEVLEPILLVRIQTLGRMAISKEPISLVPDTRISGTFGELPAIPGPCGDAGSVCRIGNLCRGFARSCWRFIFRAC